jgi:Na+/melibiose symporter-like transporter
MSFFVTLIVVTKVLLYFSSWSSSSLNDIFSLNSTLTFFSLNYWRFFTAPLATASLFDLLVVMPYLIIYTLERNEQRKGTAYAMVEFFVKSTFYVFVMSVLCKRFGPHEYYITGLMPLCVADYVVELMQKP